VGATSRLRALVATSGTPVADSAESCTLGEPMVRDGEQKSGQRPVKKYYRTFDHPNLNCKSQLFMNIFKNIHDNNLIMCIMFEK